MTLLRHALSRLKLQRSSLIETFSGALSLCSPQQAAYAPSSDGLVAPARADSFDTAFSEHTSVTQASSADLAPQAGGNEGSCAAWRHVPGIKDVAPAGQRYQNELRRPAGSLGLPGQVHCRCFSAQALPSKQPDEAEPLGFVRGGYSVEQFPPDKVCHADAIPRHQSTTAAMSQLSRATATCVQGMCSFSSCERTSSISSSCTQSWEEQWHATSWHACCRCSFQHPLACAPRQVQHHLHACRPERSDGMLYFGMSAAGEELQHHRACGPWQVHAGGSAAGIDGRHPPGRPRAVPRQAAGGARARHHR